MPTKVHTPNGIVHFPDGMSPDEIGAALEKEFPAPPPRGGQVGEDTRAFLGGLGEQLNPVTMVKGLYQAVRHPLDTGKAVIDAHKAQFSKAGTALGEGRYSEALGHGAAGLLPLVGPAAADVGERIGQGDVAGGLGAATGLIASVGLPKAVNKAMAPVRQATGNALNYTARRAMGAVVKPDRSYLEKMSGAKQIGLAGVERRVLDTILENDLAPATTGVDRAQSLIEATANARNAKIAAAPAVPVRGAGRAADNAVLREQYKVAKGTAPQGNVGKVKKLRDKMHTDERGSEPFLQRVSFEKRPAIGPDGMLSGEKTVAVKGKELRRVKDQTPQELAQTIKADNDTLRGLFGQKGKDVEAGARMAVRNTNATKLDKVAGTAKESKRMRDLIDARNVLNVAHRRIQSTNPVGLTDFIAVSTMHPVAVAASLAQKPGILAKLAKTSHKAGKKVGASAAESKALRALLLGQTVPGNQ